jgi:hypothetical protein
LQTRNPHFAPQSPVAAPGATAGAGNDTFDRKVARSTIQKSSRRTRARWKPVLEGSDRKQAIAAIRAIIADLRASRAEATNDANDCADRALLLAEAARIDGLRISRQDVRFWLDRALSLLSQRRAGPTLYGGYLGVGFDIECVRALGDYGVEGSAAIDRALVGLLSKPLPEQCQFDLVGGLVGLGVYLLARLPRIDAKTGLELLVRRLEERAEYGMGDGVAWRTPPVERMPGDKRAETLELGVAHGSAGVLALLARMHARSILPARTRTLLRRGSAWLVRQQVTDSGARFPAVAGDRSAVRAAWCAGDPGIATALYAAAQASGNRSLAREAVAIARDSAVLAQEAAKTIDACLCHGSAGLAHIFNRLYQASGDEALRDAAVWWFRAAIASRKSQRGVAGFAFFGRATTEGAIRTIPGADRTFLNGSTGVGLALVSACATRRPLWDAILLLDLPSRTA